MFFAMYSLKNASMCVGAANMGRLAPDAYSQTIEPRLRSNTDEKMQTQQYKKNTKTGLVHSCPRFHTIHPPNVHIIIPSI